jgi:hypothetical protein
MPIMIAHGMKEECFGISIRGFYNEGHVHSP